MERKNFGKTVTLGDKVTPFHVMTMILIQTFQRSGLQVKREKEFYYFNYCCYYCFFSEEKRDIYNIYRRGRGEDKSQNQANQADFAQKKLFLSYRANRK